MAVDPIHAHSTHLAQLMQSPDLTAPPPPPPPPAPVAAVEAPAPEVVEAAPVVEDAAAPVAAPKPNQAKLARSLEIQRRAEAATRRAKAEAGKLRAKPAPAPTPAKVAGAKEQTEVSAIRAQLEAEVRLAKDNPLEFARRHGVSGADIAEMVRNDTDPTARALANLRAEASNAIAQVRKEAQAKIDALQEQITAGNESQVQRNFFEFVEDAKDANPEAFKALNSGVIYSDAEIWQKANELLETRPDLRDNFDEDRLLEAVETEARKDPRWGKLQKLIGQTTPATTKPNVAAVEKTNARTKDPAPETEPRPAAPRDPSGQFAARTPMERHALHLKNVLGGLR